MVIAGALGAIERGTTLVTKPVLGGMTVLTAVIAAMTLVKV